MSSETQIVNSALTQLGSKRIVALTDTSKEATVMSALYNIERDFLLRAYNWSFAIKRVSLPALSDAPAFNYAYAYQVPTDFLKLLEVNGAYGVPGLADITGGPDSEPYKLEGQTIITDFSAPLELRYTRRVTNAAEFDPCFTSVFTTRLAMMACTALVQSTTQKESLKTDFVQAVRLAIRANAIELLPQSIPDDSWMVGRH